MTEFAGRVDFLTYAPRSGSTYLADALSRRLADTLVVPEFRLPEFLLNRSDEALARLDRNALTRILQQDRQLAPNLGFTDADVLALASRYAGADAATLIRGTVGRYADLAHRQPETVVVKLGRAVYFAELLRRRFPDARFLHCVRDGRGVVNSLLNTPKAYFAGESMGRGDVVYAAKTWRSHVQAVDSLSRAQPDKVHHLRYEDLLLRTDDQLAEVATFLGMPLAERAVGLGLRIGAPERALHQRVSLAAVAGRLDAWCDELARWQGLVAERIMARHLSEWGYDPWFGVGRHPRHVATAFARAYAVHVTATSRYAVRRGWQYRARPAAVREHIRVTTGLRGGRVVAR